MASAALGARPVHRIIRPVIDRVFPFEGTNDALAYTEAGRSKGKVVVKVR
jgi:NADPH:quinone reductase-like Zn-dependent oxidoreductase